MTITFDQKRYNQDWEKRNYYKVMLRIDQEKKGVLQELAKKENKSINRLFLDAVAEKYNIEV